MPLATMGVVASGKVISAWLEPQVARATTPDPGVIPYPFNYTCKIRGTQSNTATDWYFASQGAASGSYSYEFSRRGSATSSLTGAYLSKDGTTRTVCGIGTPVDKVNPQFIGATFENNVGDTATRASLYSSTNGVTWTFINVTNTSLSSPIFDSSDVLRIGGRANDTATGRWDDRVYWVEVRSGIVPGVGTLLWRFDAAEVPVGASSYTDPRGLTWTLTSAAGIVRG